MDVRPASAGHVRHQDRAAPRRPERLGHQPARRASTCRSRRPAAASPPTACTSSPACPASTAARDVDDLADAVGRAGQAGPRRLDAAAGAGASGCCRRELPYAALPAPIRAPGRLPIGIAETDLQPVYLDFAAEPHALLFGDVECGKSSFLRGLARGITDGYAPDQARIILVDYRRSLLGAVQTEHLIGYGTSPQVTARPDRPGRGTVMSERLPGPDVTAEQLREPQLVAAAPSCSSWSTTTTWSPAARPTRCRRCWSTWRRAATSACTWSSPAGPAAPAGRCSTR